MIKRIQMPLFCSIKFLSHESEVSFNVTGKVYGIVYLLEVHSSKSYSDSFVVWFFLIECVRSQSV